MEPLLIDASDLARLLGISRRRVLILVSKGTIPFVELGDKEPRFVKESIAQWLEGEMGKSIATLKQ